MAITYEKTNRPVFGAEDDALTGKKIVSHFIWAGATTVGDTLVISDTAGNQVVNASCPAVGSTLVLPLSGASKYMDGIVITTMTSGIVQAFIE